ncbi:MAG: hypothetical protein CH6_1099 [Candidatus Kapaibacterium sp.]|nr:MAG: hypothetical protein CH6_1099 [Candidatus Kapabacteria bacterium]
MKPYLVFKDQEQRQRLEPTYKELKPTISGKTIGAWSD